MRQENKSFYFDIDKKYNLPKKVIAVFCLLLHRPKCYSVRPNYILGGTFVPHFYDSHLITLSFKPWIARYIDKYIKRCR